MKEQHIFADAELPFHVWVRETSGGTARWVLRDASNGLSPSMRAGNARVTSEGGSGKGRKLHD